MPNLRELLSEGWIGTILGVVGILLAFIFYIKSQYRAQLAYQFDEVTLIGSRDAAFPTEVEVRYNGIPVPQLTASRLFIWNAGQRTIRGGDIVAADPVRVEFDEGTKVLKAAVLRVTREVNGVRTEVETQRPHRATLSFDFLDPNDGVTLELLHSGPSKKVQVKGTVRGMPKGITNYGRALWFAARRRPSAPFPANRPRLVFTVGFLLGLGMMLTGLLRPQIADAFPWLFAPPKPDRLQKPNWAYAAFGFIYALLPAYLLWARRRRYPAVLDSDESAQGESSPQAA